MGPRAGVIVSLLILALSVACATPQVRLQMTREIVLIPPTINDLHLEPSGQVDTRGQERTVQVTMTGDPELRASFDLKGRLQDQTMRETEPGVYVGSFQLQPNETGRLDLVAHLLHPPTGAKQDIERDEALVLVAMDGGGDDGGSGVVGTCDPAVAEEFETQLKSLTLMFEFNRYDITPMASGILTNARTILESHPECAIHVHGHADEVGSPEYNTTLSAIRAGEVATFIEQNLGIPAARVTVHRHGESMPVDTSGTPEGMARNRRVELHALAAESAP